MKRYYDWLLSIPKARSPRWRAIQIDLDTVGQIAGYVTVFLAVAFFVLVFVEFAVEYL